MKGSIPSGIIRLLLICIMIMASAGIITAEEGFTAAESDYYRLLVQGEDSDARELAQELDACAALFEEYLHYERAKLSSRLRVRIFSDRAAYTEYLAKSIGEPKDNFVFLQYTDPSMSELVGYRSPVDFQRSLVHHAFIQYLKAFIPYPPLWLQKGMAIYLEKSDYLPGEGRMEYRENLDWLKSLKTYIALETEIIPVSMLLSIDVEAANRQIESFYAQSWGLVNFLMNSPDKEYNRIFWDSLSALSAEADRQDNEAAVIDEGFAWVDKEQFLVSFDEYMDNLKTFPELVEDGIALYTQGQFKESELQFNRALELKTDHYIPYYYLGLIKYTDQDYTMSDYFYTQALERNAAPGLIYYARGITAYSADDFESARTYLTTVMEDDPSEYGVKAQELLERIDSEEAGSDVLPGAGELSVEDGDAPLIDSE